MKFAFSLTLLLYISVIIEKSEPGGIILSNKIQDSLNIADEIIKTELKAISKKGSSLDSQGKKIKLTEIPIYRCTDTFINFEKSNFFTSELLIVRVFLSGIGFELKIKEISMLFYKTTLNIPDTAFNDIIKPVLCSSFTKNDRPIQSNCEVFRSIDKKRVYIHMINGEGKDKYEVTWIVKDKKYYGRVIDKLSDP